MKSRNIKFALLATLLAAVAGARITGAQDARKDPHADKGAHSAAAFNAGGEWTGDWGMYSPPPKSGEVSPELKKHMYPEACKQMDCKVVALPHGKFEATFQGECGRPYKYTIKMLGRTAGDVALFQGSADLGEKDGGVYDWIGRASDKEFVGFFTSRGHTGTFHLARNK